MAKIARAHKKSLVVNVAPVSNEPAGESVELIRRAYDAGADKVLLNAGCPNVLTEDGGRHELLSRSPTEFLRTLYAVKKSNVKPVWVRISPQESYARTRLICGAVVASSCVDVIVTPNTWPGHVPLDIEGRPILQVSGHAGGKSGPAVSQEAAQETTWAAMSLRNSAVEVISSSGIINAEELLTRLKIGAVAAAGTTFYYESQNGWAEDTGRLLSDLASGN